MGKEKALYKRWDKSEPPEKILIMRFHAIGDIAITIPACNSLRKLFPGSRIDYLSGEHSAALLNAVSIFDNVYSIKDYPDSDTENFVGFKIDKLKDSAKLTSLLKKNDYKLIIDLQRNYISRSIRFFTGVDYYSEFDRFSSSPAALRTLNTFHLAGFENVINDCNLKIKTELLEKTKHILLNNSWDGKSKLFVLNPAGLWVTRNWPIENYVKLAKLILKDENVNFLFIGDDRILEKSKELEEKIGKSVINLAGKTSLDEAFALFQFVDATITEDSALLHFSWSSGVPTLALLGSTRSDWTSPMPPHGAALNSSDLSCGDCMQPVCKFGDVHCLTRFIPQIVYEKLKELVR